LNTLAASASAGNNPDRIALSFSSVRPTTSPVVGDILASSPSEAAETEETKLKAVHGVGTSSICQYDQLIQLQQ
jgi:hypothetical protein